MDKETLLKTAIEAVSDRDEAYGTVERNFQQIADRWTLHIRQSRGLKQPGIQFTPHDVAMMALDMKLARLAHSPNHIDSVVDIAGYAACYATLCVEKEEKDIE